MTTQAILVAILIALVVLALVVIVARRRSGADAEGHGVGSEAAAAVEDVIGELLGVDAHHDHALDSTPPPVAVPDGPADDLTRLKGLGPKAAATLGALGITRYDQLAALRDADAARIDEAMGAFKGRLARDRWIEQARFLAADDVPGFEASFGKLG